MLAHNIEKLSNNIKLNTEHIPSVTGNSDNDKNKTKTRTNTEQSFK